MKLEPRSEKGLLTPDNCVITLIDHQPQMLFGVTSIDRQSLINNVVGFAKAARIFGVPLILSTVESKAFSGNIWPQLQAIYPDQTPIERRSMNSWDDENFVSAVKKTGRKKIVLAGLWTEVCVAFPTIQAIHDGYEVYVVEDLCGDLDEKTHMAAMRRVEKAGAKPVTWIQVMLEWERDGANRDTYPAARGGGEFVARRAGARAPRHRAGGSAAPCLFARPYLRGRQWEISESFITGRLQP